MARIAMLTASYTETDVASRPSPVVRRLLFTIVLVAAAGLRLSFVNWQDPYGPHHPDEHILSFEALALWEGVTPREVGWPASTSRMLLGVVHAGQFLVDRGADLAHGGLDERLRVISQWTAEQWVDPSRLYATARLAFAGVGLLHVAVTWWALRRWFSWWSAWFGTLAAALAPLAVFHSQFVLADVMGLLWATVVLGLLRLPPGGRALLAGGAAAGLAAASKFHFGIWLVPVLLHALGARELPWRYRARGAVLAALACGLTVLLFVPWFWTAPVLAFKEFAGVVLVKVGGGGTANGLLARAGLILGGLGPLALAGAVVGVVPLVRATPRLALLVLAPTLFALAALVSSETVFDRYGLVLAPGVFLLAGAGWGWLARGNGRVRSIAVLAIALASAWSASILHNEYHRVAEPSVDRLAAQWLAAHVHPGIVVAIHSEANAFVPRTAAALERCVARAFTEDAYREKWGSNGVLDADTLGQPLRNAVLNDELFAAFWCSRESMLARDGSGFELVRFHDQPRFDSVLTPEAERRFDSGGDDDAKIGVLVLNVPRRPEAVPTTVLRTSTGARFIYAAPDAVRSVAE